MVEPTSEDEAEFSADDDDEGGGESTVAMQSPSFDPSMPSPVSIPPPRGVEVGSTAQSPVVPTAPVAFPPPGGMGGPRPAPAPDPGRSAQPVGMTAQSPAIAPGTSTRPKRAQTVIGIAPPGQGAQRPPNPALAAPPLQQRPPVTPALPTLNEDDGEGPISETAAIDMLDPKISLPTLTAMGKKTPEEMFGLDEAAGAAARAAVRPHTRHSPLASTGFSPNGSGAAAVKSASPTRMEKPAPPRLPVDQESTTTAFVEDLGLLTAKSLPKLHDNDGEDESTRAVPREELFRGQDQFVLGEDAGASGDDATLAVPPGMNEAASQRFGAGMASPLGADGSGGHPSPFLGSAHPTQQSPQFPVLGPPPSWNQPAGPGVPSQHAPHGMSQMPSSTSAMPMIPGYNQGPNQAGPMAYPSNGMPGQQPMPMGYPQQGWPPQWGMPGQPQMVPVAPGTAGRPDGEKRKFPLSGQVIALGVVGIVCLAIFVTGVVLFFTTKF